MPARWARLSTRHTWSTICAASSRGIRPMRLIRVDTSSPMEQLRMTMNGTPSAVTPWSWIWTTWGLLRSAGRRGGLAGEPGHGSGVVDDRRRHGNFTATWVFKAR